MPATPRLIAALLVALAAAPLVAQSAIQYMYDEIGRLIAVVDPGGDTATYTYDAVGNLLEIERFASTTVSVISFTPPSGPVGTTVKVRGTGFSTTPASNTVTFNGTGATVSAATATQLTVTVPSGATTGTIAVTAPGGSATSATAFTVTTSSAPTITSFTPSIGVAGTSVSITGTNFETTALKNRLQFNLTSMAASSSTSTSISTAAPTNTASGPIKVSTAFGQAVSTDDFFVAPYPYVAADVVDTGRMGYNDAEAVGITTATKIGLVVFDGTAGQRVSLKINPASSGVVTIYKPDGTTLATKSNGVLTDLIEPALLPRTGTYTVNVDHSGNGTGTTTVTAYDVPADASGTITAGGSSATSVITTPGQNGVLTFSGTSGQRVSVKDTAGPTGTMYLRHPDGSTLASMSMSGSSSFLDVQTLTTTGTHSLYINPVVANTGTSTVNLYDVPADVTGSITAGGSAVNVVITTPGQNALLTFSGTNGDRVSATTGSGGPSGSLIVLNPDGSTLGSGSGSGSIFLTPKTLTQTGTHTLKVDPQVANIGTAVTTLYAVVDASGTLTVNGSAVGVTISAPGANGAYTFSGTASQLLTVRVTSNTTEGTFKLLKPDGSTLVSTLTNNANFNLAQQTLPTTGTYTVSIDPLSTSTGSLNLAVTDP
jgi:YD repeat-containing protein